MARGKAGKKTGSRMSLKDFVESVPGEAPIQLQLPSKPGHASSRYSTEGASGFHNSYGRSFNDGYRPRNMHNETGGRSYRTDYHQVDLVPTSRFTSGQEAYYNERADMESYFDQDERIGSHRLPSYTPSYDFDVPSARYHEPRDMNSGHFSRAVRQLGSPDLLPRSQPHVSSSERKYSALVDMPRAENDKFEDAATAVPSADDTAHATTNKEAAGPVDAIVETPMTDVEATAVTQRVVSRSYVPPSRRETQSKQQVGVDVQAPKSEQSQLADVQAPVPVMTDRVHSRTSTVDSFASLTLGSPTHNEFAERMAKQAAERLARNKSSLWVSQPSSAAASDAGSESVSVSGMDDGRSVPTMHVPPPSASVRPPLYLKVRNMLSQDDRTASSSPSSASAETTQRAIVGSAAPERPSLNLAPRTRPVAAHTDEVRRPKLQLQPRSCAHGGGMPSSRTASIFGAARPREDVLRERGVPDSSASYTGSERGMQSHDEWHTVAHSRRSGHLSHALEV